ncbi:hypothetical protein D3C85_1621140 [compost metagenome]
MASWSVTSPLRASCVGPLPLPGNCGNQTDNAPSAVNAIRLKSGICQLLRTLLRARWVTRRNRNAAPPNSGPDSAPQNTSVVAAISVVKWY